MELSELTIKIIIIISPGIITSLIFNYLTVSRKQSDFKFVIVSIVFGLINYLILQSLYWFIQWVTQICSFFNKIEFRLLGTLDDLGTSSTIYWGEVSSAIILSVVLGFLYSYIDHHKVINKIAWYFGVTNKYGSENAYSYFLNFENIDYVYIRCISSNLTYCGKISVFSENDGIREIILEDVKVYDYGTSEWLYDIDKVYLVLNDDVIIEQPKYI